MELRIFPLFLALFMAGCTYVSDSWADGGPLKVHVLDVGQGLSVLMEAGGRFALYDAGPDSVGVLDSLERRGVDTLEWVLISHYHRDHGGGFMELASPGYSGGRTWKPHVRRLVVGTDTAGGFVRDSVMAVARRWRIPVDTVRRGDTLYLADGIRLECLWPAVFTRAGENGASVVMALETSGGRMLLTGDLDSTAERKLLELSPRLSADFLQVPHHGSAGSSTLKFLSQVAPSYAIISVGAKNSYGHPTSAVLQKLQKVIGDSSCIFRTDLHGTQSFELVPGVGVVH